jgi:hypothetical protein
MRLGWHNTAVPQNAAGKARPQRIRLRLSDVAAPGAIPLELPSRPMWAIGLAIAGMFVIFAGVEWAVLLRMSRHSVTDLFDLMFLLFEGFWMLGWSVGVVILGALAVLLFFYGESARLQSNELVHIPRLGPFKVLLDYDLAQIRNLRLENAGSNDSVRLRFDYGDGVTSLGDAMPRPEAQRLLDTIRSASQTAGATHSVAPESERAPVLPRETELAESKSPSSPDTAEEPPLSITSTSGLALIGANMVPLFGVLFLGWDLSNVMVLFWAESAVIAFYTALKMTFVGNIAAFLAVPFFVGHFGGFMAGHFLLIYMFFIRGTGTDPEPAVRETLRVIFTPLAIPIAALFISHGISFVTNFIGRREYAATTMAALMTAPYNRIIMMQLALIFGGWIILLLKSPVPALVVLVLVKTALDFSAHRTEHLRVGRAA